MPIQKTRLAIRSVFLRNNYSETWKSSSKLASKLQAMLSSHHRHNQLIPPVCKYFMFEQDLSQTFKTLITNIFLSIYYRKET